MAAIIASDHVFAANQRYNKRRPDGRTAHALAALHGNDEVAAWLLRHGAKDELTRIDRFVAACTFGNQAQAGSLFKEHLNLRNELRPEHHLMMHTPAERGMRKLSKQCRNVASIQT